MRARAPDCFILFDFKQDDAHFVLFLALYLVFINYTVLTKGGIMNKKHIFYFGFVLVTLIGLQSCRTTEEVIDTKPTEVHNDATQVPFKNVASGYLTGNGAEGIEEGGMVINSQENWDALRAKMNSVNNAISEQSIDFNKMTVLAYFDQVRGSGGYTVDFATVSQIGTSVQVIVQKVDSEGNDIEIMTQPYSIVQIEKTVNTVVFINQ